jgi:hypothetical protein
MGAGDGFYTPKQMQYIELKRFNSEKDMKLFICKYINNFCQDILGVKLDKYQTEYKLSDGRKKSKSIDILIYATNGDVIALELKNPKHKAELQSALGQCLVYLTSSEITGLKINRFVLVSSQFDYLIPLTIDNLNLPIEFVVMDEYKYSKMSLINGRSTKEQ